jgi:hypothetical protein
MVCSSCNRAKAFGHKSINRAIDEVVKRREGYKTYKDMVDIDMSKATNPNWTKRWWLEEELERLQNVKKEIIRSREICEHHRNGGGIKSVNTNIDISDSGDITLSCRERLY